MADERKLTEEEEESFRIQRGDLNAQLAHFGLCYNDFRPEIECCIVTALIYAEKRREEERCKYEYHTDTWAYFTQCGKSVNEITFWRVCPFCMKRIEVTP